MKKRSFLTAVIALVVLAAVLGVCVAVEKNVVPIRADLAVDTHVYSAGKDVMPEDGTGKRLCPIVYDGNIYLPVKAFEDLGVKAEWDKEGRTVDLTCQIEDAVRFLQVGAHPAEGGPKLLASAYGDLKDEVLIELGKGEYKPVCLLCNLDANHTVVFHVMDHDSTIMDVMIPAGETKTVLLPEGVNWLKITSEIPEPEAPESGAKGGAK